MEKYIPCKWEEKESWNSNPHIKQNRPNIKKITGDQEGHYVIIKGSIQNEDITIVNIYAPNIGILQYIRQTLTDIKGEIDSNTIIVGDPTHTNGQIIKTKLIRKHKSLFGKTNTIL